MSASSADRCPVCGEGGASVFLHREHVPVHQNLVVSDRDAARTMTQGELDFAVCHDCGFVYNRAFDLAKLDYGEEYDNTQSCSAYFDAYLDGLIRRMVEDEGVRECTIVEVGCGKGHFLRKLVEYPESGNRGYGFDPSYVGPDSDCGGRLQFRRCYYDDSCTDVAADVVVCRHVIEHVPEPLALLRSVRAALERSPRARVFFETPCVEWILRHRVLADFFYEHCSLFSAHSLGLAFRRSGFDVRSVEHIFGGQYLWLEASVATEATGAPRGAGKSTAELARAYGAEEQALRMRWRARVDDLRRTGKVALWGAGAKGATIASLLDADCTLLDSVVDINPNKQGRCIPGTGHPIVAPRDLSAREVRSVILMNPNYRAENEAMLAEAGIDIDLIEWKD